MHEDYRQLFARKMKLWSFEGGVHRVTFGGLRVHSNQFSDIGNRGSIEFGFSSTGCSAEQYARFLKYLQ